jgi:hypothetical protein
MEELGRLRDVRTKRLSVKRVSIVAVGEVRVVRTISVVTRSVSAVRLVKYPRREVIPVIVA